MNKVCVLGSINMDLVVKVNEIPRIGETILSKSFEKIAGGKGANQAIAARRCGAEVSMIAKIGKDENGKILKSKLEEDKISTECVFEDEKEPYKNTSVLFCDGKIPCPEILLQSRQAGSDQGAFSQVSAICVLLPCAYLHQKV